ncbi:MAG: xanthine dehydrogenase family protein, partial [Candidatus Tectomicrobia bacterium]|nr:xanthine dehydrogenase family protein [Candidatus Tectomicrobia bacterium]
MSSFRIIGSRAPMVGSTAKVAGTAQFATDMKPQGLLHGKVLRSTQPHARIGNIDVSQALKVPGVVTVVTGKDIPPGARYGTLRREQAALAIDKVRFIGEEVAAVAATSREAAEEAVERIVVEYDPLPAYFSPEEAMAEGAALIHGDVPGNVAHRLRFEKGESVEALFAASDVVLEESFYTGTQYHAFTEPNCTVADPTDGSRLIMYVPCQKVFLGRDRLAMGLGLSASRVRLIQPSVGGAFGGKSIDEPNAFINGLLALKSRRPVKLENLRTESFRTTRMRVPAKSWLRIGAMKDGTLTAHELHVVADCGAFAGPSAGIVNTMVTRWPSLYRWKGCKVKADMTYTNNPPKGAFRGFGTPQTTYGGEVLMDMLAEKLGMEPAELRLKNVLAPGELSIHKWNAITNALPECIRKAVEMVDWKRKREESRKQTGTKRRGIGLACANHVSGNRIIAGWDGSSALIRAQDDGRISLFIGEGDTGQGAPTVLSMFAAEELGIQISDVDLCPADSDIAPYTLGSFASRITMIGGNAVRRAAQDLKQKLARVVAAELEANPDDLVFEGGRIFVKGSPERGVPLGEAAHKERLRVDGSPAYGVGHYEAESEVVKPPRLDGNVAPGYEFVAQIAEVEVDTETGQVELLDFVTVDDVGRIVSALGAEGQTEGAIVQGLGWALYENIIFENGQPVNGNLADYSVPKAETVPAIRHAFIESDDPLGPYGAKGCSEGPVNP